MSILASYSTFVDGVTSSTSKNDGEFINNLKWLSHETEGNIARLLTGVIGLNGEFGEFSKAYNDFKAGKCTVEEVELELGDLWWYYAQVCMAMDLDLDYIIPQPAAPHNGLPYEICALTDLFKKILFQGKALSEQNAKVVDSVKRIGFALKELSNEIATVDIILQKNITKLESRYPGGKFSVAHSEKRNG